MCSSDLVTPVSENGAPESGFWDFDDNQESSNQQTVGGRRESIDSARHEQPQFDDRAVEDRLPLLDDEIGRASCRERV